MFTIDQIKDVHAKVKSGKNFPDYVRDLILPVTCGSIRTDRATTRVFAERLLKPVYRNGRSKPGR